MDRIINQQENNMKQSILDRIEEIEILIQVYNDRDQVRTQQLTVELDGLNMQLLDLMVA